jgi:two-component system, LuxR family, sensor kinase FixL
MDSDRAGSGDASRAKPSGRWLLLRRELPRYGIAPIAVALAFVLRVALMPLLPDDAPYLLFIPAVLVAAAFGGLGPGLLATGLSLLLGLLFVASAPYDVPELVNAAIFSLIGAGIAWSGEQLHRYRQRAAASARDALGREAHLQSILDTVLNAMIVIDERGMMQSFSSAAERLFGHTAAEMLGQNVKMLMPSPYRDNHDG